VIGQNIANQAAEYMDAMARVNHYSGVVLIAKNNKILFARPYMGLPTGTNACPTR